MDSMQRKKNAAAFAAEWSGRGYEKGDAQVFWTELLQQIVGMQNISRNVRFEYRTASGGFIDCLIPDAGVIVEQKGLDIDLDKPEERQGRMVTPFEQALAYAESFPRNRQPRFVVVCNFSTFRVHDRDAYPPFRARGQVRRVHPGGARAEPAPVGLRHRPRQQPIRAREAGLDGGGPPHRRAALPAADAVHRPRVRGEPEGPQHPVRAPGVLPVLRGRGALPQGRALELPEER